MTISRRTLLHIVGLTALASPLTAWADRQRILADGPDVPMPAAPGHLPDWKRAMSALRIGSASRHGALTVFWLSANTSAPPLEIATLDEARASGALIIAERERAAVPELSVDNRGKGHVLLLAGEILVGGKQNRVLREDILLPPLSGPRPIGVYCVEQGRWNEGRKEFESKGTFAQPGLRSSLMERADQGRVWDSVAKAAREAAPASQSPTTSYQAIYDDARIKGHLSEVERLALMRPPVLAHGAAVFFGPSLSGLDLFHAPGLFAREWPKLLRAYAVETYNSKMLPRDVPEAKLRAHVEGLLAQAARVEGSLRGNAGVGQLF